jgi:hypothetical protein
VNLPTQHQLAVLGTHVAAGAASAIAVIGFTHIADSSQVADATTAIGQISDGVALIMKGGGTLGTIGIAIYATVKSGPFASLLRAVTSIASDPAKLAQVQQNTTGATLPEKAALVLVTDKLPEVAGIGTTRDEAGKELAMSVPSPTVQTIATASPPNVKAV